MNLFGKSTQNTVAAIAASASLAVPLVDTAQAAENIRLDPPAGKGELNRIPRVYYTVNLYMDVYAKASGAEREQILSDALKNPKYIIADCIKQGLRVVEDPGNIFTNRRSGAETEALHAFYAGIGNEAIPFAEKLTHNLSSPDVRGVLFSNPKVSALGAAKRLDALAQEPTLDYMRAGDLVWLIGRSGPDAAAAAPTLLSVIEKYVDSVEYPRDYSRVVKDCLRALSEIAPDSPEVKKVSSKLLSNPRFGPWAGELLGQLGSSGIEAASQVILHAENSVDREQAIKSLEYMGPSGVQVLIACLENPNTRADAAKVIQALGPEAAQASSALEKLHAAPSQLSAKEREAVELALTAVHSKQHALGSTELTKELAEKLLAADSGTKADYVLYPDSILQEAYCWVTRRGESFVTLRRNGSGYLVDHKSMLDFISTGSVTELGSKGELVSQVSRFGSGRDAFRAVIGYSHQTAREDQARINTFLQAIEDQGGLTSSVTQKQIFSIGMLIATAAIAEVGRRHWRKAGKESAGSQAIQP